MTIARYKIEAAGLGPDSSGTSCDPRPGVALVVARVLAFQAAGVLASGGEPVVVSVGEDGGPVYRYRVAVEQVP